MNSNSKFFLTDFQNWFLTKCIKVKNNSVKLLLESSKISYFQLTRLSFLFSSKIWIFTIELNISLMFKSFSKARWPQRLIHKNFKNAWFTKQSDWKCYEDFIENEDPIETEDQMEDWKFHWKFHWKWRLFIFNYRLNLPNYLREIRGPGS